MSESFIAPIITLARALNMEPSVVDKALHDNGLTVTVVDQESRTREWERKLRNGTLSERKIIGQ